MDNINNEDIDAEEVENASYSQLEADEDVMEVEDTISTITDNASNMVKAFKTFGVHLIDVVDDDDDTNEDNHCDDEEACTELEDFTFTGLCLPKHQRFNHFVSLINL